jgi:hypothetical protein
MTVRACAWLGLLVCLSCGPIDFDDTYPPPGGPVCYDDTDCAPNACCGEGDAVVHVDQAPDCSLARCSGSCPIHGIRCGCAVPVCRSGQCVAAISPTPDCS